MESSVFWAMSLGLASSLSAVAIRADLAIWTIEETALCYLDSATVSLGITSLMVSRFCCYFP